MYWQESNDNERYIVPDDIVDVVYNIQCRALPVDHAYALSLAIAQALPWFTGEEKAGMHTIHVADSGNGWMRPENPDDLLYLSRRTKLMLRLPKHRVDDAIKLTGCTLDIRGNAMQVEKAAVRSLSTITTLFSRYIVCHEDEDEAKFLQSTLARLGEMAIQPKKMLCGMKHVIATPDRNLPARSLMLADLTVAESIQLQQHGLGDDLKLGCGLFIPHKNIKEIKSGLD